MGTLSTLGHISTSGRVGVKSSKRDAIIECSRGVVYPKIQCTQSVGKRTDRGSVVEGNERKEKIVGCHEWYEQDIAVVQSTLKTA